MYLLSKWLLYLLSSVFVIYLYTDDSSCVCQSMPGLCLEVDLI